MSGNLKASDSSSKHEEQVFAYHQQSKHHLSAYAKGPDTIDWSTQPEAFRHYKGAASIDLPFALEQMQTGYDQMFTPLTTSQTLNLQTLSGLLQLALGLSAWKQYGTDRWALRCNPSSGNLHPTEAYVLLNNLTGVENGIYHYCPDQHQLEKRCDINLEAETTSVLFCLSSIHWREAWKYGERAFRYSQLDIGHAMAAIRYATACYGWRLNTILSTSNHAMNKLFGFDRHDDYVAGEAEYSEVLLSLQTGSDDQAITLEKITTSNWQGKANLLDRQHFYDWPPIDKVELASENPGVTERQTSKHDYPAPLVTSTENAGTIITQRRSAQYFDGRTIMPEAVFWKCIDKMLPRSDCAPFDILPWQARIHPLIFIHRVENIERGLYILPRHAGALEIFKQEFRQDFIWQQKHSEYRHLSVYKLIQANCESAAKTLFCHQDIAGQSAFSIAMLAEFRNQLIDAPWRYRQLFWEAGILGQSLYLEAEANNFRATGIGCFFDDNLHDVLGLKTDRLQSLYHFTVGTPVIDQRITSLSGYHHIQR